MLYSHAQYDWTTGVPDNEVPRRTSLVPLAFPCFLHCLIGMETEGLLDYQGRAGDHFHCAVEPSPGHIRCRFISGRRRPRKLRQKSPPFSVPNRKFFLENRQSNNQWGGKKGSICHFAFSLVLQYLWVPTYPDAGKNSTKSVIVNPFLCAPNASKN